MILDFKEIPKANSVTGEQDTFEMFARDFLEELGFKIVEGPDRGPDGGRDLIIEEERVGIFDNSNIRWLVSCKHKAHSGKSVTDADDYNIFDRIQSNKTDGFIGFYSTLPSSGLQRLVRNGIGKQVKFFDREVIEKMIIEKNMNSLMRRYFPNSLKKYEAQRHTISNFLGEYVHLKCESCSKDLLEKEIQGSNIVVFLGKYKNNIEYVEDIYWSCKKTCDKIAKKNREKKGLYELSWQEISNLIIPTGFIKWLFFILNGMRNGNMVYNDEAFEKLKYFIIAISQLILKDTTKEERKKILNSI